MAMQFLQVMNRKCVLPVKFYENSSISATRMSFLSLFWIFPVNNLNYCYIASYIAFPNDGCLADLGFVANRPVILANIWVKPTTNCYRNEKCIFEIYNPICISEKKSSNVA